MARSSFRNHKNTAASPEQGLHKKWSQAIGLLDGYGAELLDGLFRSVKRLMGDKLYRACLNGQGLCAYDESIYSHYHKLMECYGELMRLHDQYESGLLFADHKIQSIYEGLFAVLLSRIRLFEENQAGETEHAGLNMIMLEKKELIVANLRGFARAFDQLHYNFKGEYQRALLLEARHRYMESIAYEDGREVAKTMADAVLNGCGEAFCVLYQSAAAGALTQLNDLEKRRKTAYYIDMLNEEHQILGAIVKVQAAALEQEIRQGSESAETVQVLQSMLLTLREAYQFFGRETAEVLSKLRRASEGAGEKGLLVHLEDGEGFAADIVSLLQKEELLPAAAFHGMKEAFLGQLALFKEAVIQQAIQVGEMAAQHYNPVKDYYEIRKTFSYVESMAAEMRTAFTAIAQAYESEREALSIADQTGIIRGVAETIEIKIESIKENQEAFHADMEAMLANVTNEKPEIDRDQLIKQAELCYDQIINDLLLLGKDDRRGIVAMKQNFAALTAGEAVTLYQEKLARSHAQRLDKAKRKATTFVKEHLLFELTTFEEINRYSVSRLRESEDEATAAFVALIDRQDAALKEILKRNHIKTIEPMPYDTFNGKEHEVLMAEQNPAFKKGEIIKVMNCGYRMDDMVLLRANVIAAK